MPNRLCFLLAAVLGLVTSATSTAESPPELAQKAKTILQAKCHSCHGEGGSSDGNINFMLDRNRLVKRRKIVPGKSVESVLFRQVKTGTMPKGDEPLSKDELDTLKRWIDGGAIDFNPPAAPRPFIDNESILSAIQKDLQKQADSDPEKLPFLRYFTITHLYNAGFSDDELESYRVALAKLVNSLSWKKRIVVPQPIDAAKTILRINLNDYRWTAKTWDRILAENPYGVKSASATAKFCYDQTKSDLPHVRADWFVAKAAVPPLYHDILELPATDRDLEKLLQIDVAHNITIGEAVRAGFNGSGVSTHNRLLERHECDLTGGAYWKSYDFGDDKGRKNLFSHPLGPGGANGFQHDGGELIFNLPNGLQAYLLVGPDGKRIDKGPIDVVSDPKRPDKQVVNGLSCMSCHSEGMKRKSDQVRDAVLANANAFSSAEIAQVKKLYRPADEFDKWLDEDAERFAKAVKQTGGKLTGDEPIVTLALRFEEELDADLAAAEVGVPTQTLLDGISKSGVLARLIPSLKVPGGTVKREVFLASFGVIVGDLKVGKFVTRAPKLVVGKRPGELWEGNGLEMKFCWCPPGTFAMGSPASEPLSFPNEDQVQVTLTKGFWMGKYEVMQSEWQQLMGTTITQQVAKGSFGRATETGARQPMSIINHDEATEFCVKLTDQERRAGRLPNDWEYRLPTEAQWEYACRAGTRTTTAFGNSLSSALANFNGTSSYSGTRIGTNLRRTTEVGSYKPNDWGLCDMHGNVWEWCGDWYGEKLPGGRDPAVLQASGNPSCVYRGGSWEYGDWLCYSAHRGGYEPKFRSDNGGFRVAIVQSR